MLIFGRCWIVVLVSLLVFGGCKTNPSSVKTNPSTPRSGSFSVRTPNVEDPAGGGSRPSPDDSNENPASDDSNENPSSDHSNENPSPDHSNENPASDDSTENPASEDRNGSASPEDAVDEDSLSEMERIDTVKDEFSDDQSVGPKVPDEGSTDRDPKPIAPHVPGMYSGDVGKIALAGGVTVMLRCTDADRDAMDRVVLGRVVRLPAPGLDEFESKLIVYVPANAEAGPIVVFPAHATAVAMCHKEFLETMLEDQVIAGAVSTRDDLKIANAMEAEWTKRHLIENKVVLVEHILQGVSSRIPLTIEFTNQDNYRRDSYDIAITLTGTGSECSGKTVVGVFVPDSLTKPVVVYPHNGVPLKKSTEFYRFLTALNQIDIATSSLSVDAVYELEVGSQVASLIQEKFNQHCENLSDD